MSNNQSTIIKVESTRTGMEHKDDAMWSPKSPQPTVGVIVISDEESMEETENDGWTNPALSDSQVGSPPESPEYTTEPTDDSLEETNTNIDWKGSLNLTAINP